MYETGAARTVFVVDNDFRNMGKKAPPESLMRATATHEFNHVVQHGYDAEEGLRWLYEATASWTETNTVGRDQDATDYVETDYAAQLCWTTNTRGHDYAQWTLLRSLADSYGDQIVVRLWENSVAYDGFETMSRTLAGVGTTIPDVIERWRAQNFARDYDLAPLFTRTVRLGGTISRNGSWSPRGNVEQLGAHYVALRLRGRGARLRCVARQSGIAWSRPARRPDRGCAARPRRRVRCVALSIRGVDGVQPCDACGAWRMQRRGLLDHGRCIGGRDACSALPVQRAPFRAAIAVGRASSHSGGGLSHAACLKSPELRVEGALEGGPGGAAFDIGGEALARCW